MDLETVLIYSIIQSSVILLILFFKKFRNFSNLFFGCVMVLLIIHHLYYILWHRGELANLPYLLHWIKPFTAAAPIFIWYYATAFITGRIYSFGKMMSHFVPFYVLVLGFVPLIYFQLVSSETELNLNFDRYNRIYGILSFFIIGTLFLYFSFDILQQLYKTCSKKPDFWNNLFDFSNERLLLIKFLAILIFSTGLVSFFQGILEILGKWENTFYFAESIVILVLGYWFLFVIIYSPKIIHFKMKEIKAGGKMLSYEKSGLEEEEALLLMNKMNEWMETDKPFVNGNLSLTDFAEKFEIPGYILSEVLNRLVKQNFYEYVNNYRIEEFKKQIQAPKNKNIKLLNVAFDVGFNSKTTFNTSFKKFTGKTPSEYRNSLL